MGIGSLITSVRQRPLQGVITAADTVLRPQDLLDDLGRIGDAARPVVIQGGYTTDAYLYEPLKDILQKRGFADVTATKLDFHGIASIESDAHNLKRMVDAASARSIAAGGDGLVTVLAHSKGGEAARWYLQRMGGVEHVDQLITMGTPHNGVTPLGTRLAALAAMMPGMTGLRQLRPGSKELVALNSELPTFMETARRSNPEFRIVSIAGDVDVPFVGGTDGLVWNRDSKLDDRIAGLYNLVFRGRGAHHGAIVAQYGVFEPTLRSATLLAARSSFAQAAEGAALLTPT